MAVSPYSTEALEHSMLGNKAAASFLVMMIDILHCWDDLIDRDKPVSDDAINSAFFNALVLLPRNAFYTDNFNHLNPVLVNAITNWHVANRMERNSDDYKLQIAYILRSSYCDLVTQCAMLVGGPDHAIEIGYLNRMNAHKETWNGYKTNLAAEITARTNSKE